jgi:hypothetical protein
LLTCIVDEDNVDDDVEAEDAEFKVDDEVGGRLKGGAIRTIE